MRPSRTLILRGRSDHHSASRVNLRLYVNGGSYGTAACTRHQLSARTNTRAGNQGGCSLSWEPDPSSPIFPCPPSSSTNSDFENTKTSVYAHRFDISDCGGQLKAPLICRSPHCATSHACANWPTTSPVASRCAGGSCLRILSSAVQHARSCSATPSLRPPRAPECAHAQHPSCRRVCFAASATQIRDATIPPPVVLLARRH